MSIIIKGLSVPQDCTDCACTNYFGGCLLVAKLKPDVSIEEYDDEWHKAHKEHRRMKWCPLKSYPREYEAIMEALESIEGVDFKFINRCVDDVIAEMPKKENEQIRKVLIPIMIPLDYPEDWDDDMINFHLNESSWCLGNALDVINKYAEKHEECICNISFGVVLPKEEANDTDKKR